VIRCSIGWGCLVDAGEGASSPSTTQLVGLLPGRGSVAGQLAGDVILRLLDQLVLVLAGRRFPAVSQLHDRRGGRGVGVGRPAFSGQLYLCYLMLRAAGSGSGQAVGTNTGTMIHAGTGEHRLPAARRPGGAGGRVSRLRRGAYAACP
jgi:hypothetical protein